MTLPSGLAGGPVYPDHNATTPVDPRVVEACLPYLNGHRRRGARRCRRRNGRVASLTVELDQLEVA